MRYTIVLALLLCFGVPSGLSQSAPSEAQKSPTAVRSDNDAIRGLEGELITAETTTDIAAFERILGDDYVNLNPRGMGPGKNKILEGMKPHAGQAAPYSVEMNDLEVYVLGDTAVAASVRTYTAKANGNTAKEDTTHIFVRDNGTWKLKISRASNCPMN